ncbi:hypothetical protein AAC387_Pa02g1745 [Persea americana]
MKAPICYATPFSSLRKAQRRCNDGYFDTDDGFYDADDGFDHSRLNSLREAPRGYATPFFFLGESLTTLQRWILRCR